MNKIIDEMFFHSDEKNNIDCENLINIFKDNNILNDDE